MERSVILESKIITPHSLGHDSNHCNRQPSRF
jgi:hypothetical protein